ncbi:hypothetical protein WJX77_008754 [Trebouxia sp. C0004]
MGRRAKSRKSRKRPILRSRVTRHTSLQMKWLKGLEDHPKSGRDEIAYRLARLPEGKLKSGRSRACGIRHGPQSMSERSLLLIPDSSRQHISKLATLKQWLRMVAEALRLPQGLSLVKAFFSQLFSMSRPVCSDQNQLAGSSGTMKMEVASSRLSPLRTTPQTRRQRPPRLAAVCGLSTRFVAAVDDDENSLVFGFPGAPGGSDGDVGGGRGVTSAGRAQQKASSQPPASVTSRSGISAWWKQSKAIRDQEEGNQP